MTDEAGYPPFDPPQPPSRTHPKHWTKAQPRIYFDWIVGQSSRDRPVF
jgi:hypothetical protein